MFIIVQSKVLCACAHAVCAGSIQIVFKPREGNKETKRLY